MKNCFVMIPEFSRIHGGLSLLSVPAYSKQPLEGQKPSSFFLNSFVWSFKSLIDLIWFGLKIIKKKTQIRQ
jgi:hypothetical protein